MFTNVLSSAVITFNLKICCLGKSYVEKPVAVRSGERDGQFKDHCL